jgi:hypothetical protein
MRSPLPGADWIAQNGCRVLFVNDAFDHYEYFDNASPTPRWFFDVNSQ